MTTPQPPPQPPPPEVPPPLAAAQNTSAMIPVLLGVIAAYLVTRPALGGPWRAVAAALGLPALAGGALDALARRALDAQRRASGKRGADLWEYNERAVTAGVDAGLQGLVQILRAVESRKVRLPKAPVPVVVVQDLALAPAPHPNTAPEPPPGGAGPIPDPDPFRLNPARTPPPAADDTPPPTVLTPASLNDTALDLVDLVINATTNQSAELAAWTKTWITRGDDKVRPMHRLIAGQTIPATAAFYTPEGIIRFPHDPEAPIGMVANCRCELRFQKAVKRVGVEVAPPGQVAASGGVTDGLSWVGPGPDVAPHVRGGTDGGGGFGGAVGG